MIPLLLVLVLLVPHEVQAARGKVVLQKEMKFPVSTSLPLKDLVVATKLGLLNRHWEFKSVNENTVEATFTKSDILLKIRILVSGNQVIMQYVDSKGLDYGTDSGDYGDFAPTHPKGTMFIHASYDKWLRGLFSDIEVEIKRLMVMKGLL